MTRWAPFLWLTGVVLVLLLGLARLSSGVVRDETTYGDRPTPPRDRLAEPGEPTAATAGPLAHVDEPGHPDGLVDRADEPPAVPPAHEPPAVPPADEPPEDPAVRVTTSRGPAGEPVEIGSSEEPDPIELSSWMLLANVALTQGLVGLAVVAGLWWFEIPGSAIGVTGDPWVGGLPALGLGLAFGLALWLGNEAAAGIADTVGAAYDEAVRSMLAPTSPGGWAVLLGLVLPTVAVVEELLFRGALIGVPAAGFDVSPWLLAVVSSVAFALGHGAQGRVGVLVTGVLGFVLAAGYVLSGSLLVVVVAHYVVNAMEFVVHEGLGFDRILTV